MSEIICECGHDVRDHVNKAGCIWQTVGRHCECTKSAISVRADNTKRLEAEIDALKKKIREWAVILEDNLTDGINAYNSADVNLIAEMDEATK